MKAKFNVQKKKGVEWKLVWSGGNGCEVKKKRKLIHSEPEEKGV